MVNKKSRIIIKKGRSKTLGVSLTIDIKLPSDAIDIRSVTRQRKIFTHTFENQLIRIYRKNDLAVFG